MTIEVAAAVLESVLLLGLSFAATDCETPDSYAGVGLGAKTGELMTWGRCAGV